MKPKRAEAFLEISGQALRGGSAKLLKDWWTWSGSNRRPLPCHGSALPAAPQAHVREELLLLFAPAAGPSVNARQAARTQHRALREYPKKVMKLPRLRLFLTISLS